jgi:hypothetical protein
MRRWLIAAAMVVAVVALSQLLPNAAATGDDTWEDGTVRYYDSSGIPRTVATAVARWNTSGADVRLVQVKFEDEADVLIETDDERLRRTCGHDCLGYSTDIGPPDDGRGTVLLGDELAGNPRPLSVWVVAHELGHVLGLSHRGDTECSLMSEHAFDSRCAPAISGDEPTPEQLVCVPAPADVKAATELYGGIAWRNDRRCR